MLAAIYARKSTEQAVSDDQKSIARQVEHARAYAAGRGWTVAEAHVYTDDGISGAEFANRPGFLRLMNALKPRAPFQVLIMSEESRLGREAIETAYALKQLIQAGVRVFFYLENRERTLDSPTDKIMLSLTTFADELERHKAQQRTSDAMIRKARAGHVTGGLVFGYQNVEVTGPNGERSHVERRIDPDQAAVVREIFELYAAGVGVRSIAKRLNDDRRLCPRAQQGRPNGWAPSSVWSVLRRPLYRGEIVWNRTKKRDTWGAKHRTRRAEADLVRVPAQHLRIIEDALWQAVQAHASAKKATYLKTAGGSFGRPADARESKYLLTGFARCGECGANMLVRSRDHGQRRAHFYACSAFHRRGRAVCSNSLAVPVELADDAVLREIERHVLHPAVVQRAIELTLDALRPDAQAGKAERERLDRERRRAESEVANLTAALAAGGADLQPLIAALRAADQRRQALAEQLAGLTVAGDAFTTATAAALERQVLDKLAAWRATMRQEAPEARQVLREVIAERVALTPAEADGKRFYRFRGLFSFGGLFEGTDCPRALASPPGFEPGF
ncbi:MAG: recombinase family protein [Vicinamibacterales bacterium]